MLIKRFLPSLPTARSALASIVTCILIAPAFAQSASEDAELLRPDALKVPWVGFRSAECKTPADGPGLTPEDPFVVEDFYDLQYHARVWFDETKGSETNAAERRNDRDVTIDLNCRWVKLQGYFRQDDYQHYRGRLWKSPQDFYTRGGPAGGLDGFEYWVENWLDSDARSLELNAKKIEVIGQFYDLCRHAREEEKAAGIDWIVMSGPCHYGELSGLMLRDVRLARTIDGARRRLAGERNRHVIGNIAPLPNNWPQRARVKAAALDWVETLRKGKITYWEIALSDLRTAYEKQEFAKLLQRRKEDNDRYENFLSEAPDSPISRSKRIERNEFAIFASQDAVEEKREIRYVYACFCVRRDCDDEWPLFSEDADFYFDSYVCTGIRRDYKDASNWYW